MWAICKFETSINMINKIEVLAGKDTVQYQIIINDQISYHWVTSQIGGEGGKHK